MRTKYYFTIMKNYKWEITYPRMIDFKDGKLMITKRLPRYSLIKGENKEKWIDLVIERHLSILMTFPKDFGKREYA